VVGVVAITMSLVPITARAEQRMLAEGLKELASEVVASAAKNDNMRIAIVPFRELDGTVTVLGTYLAEALTTNLFRAGGIEIVERAMLDKVLQELKLGESGVIDGDTAKMLGKVAGVDSIVTGSITDLATYVSINCRMIDTETGRVFAAAETTIFKDDNLRKIMGVRLGGQGVGSGKRIDETKPEGVSGASAKPPLPQKTKLRDFTFELERCIRTESAVTCHLLVRNDGPPANLTIFGSGAGSGSRAFDDSNTEYSGSRSRLGSSQGAYATESLPHQGESRAVVWWDYVPSHVASFDRLDLGVRIYIPSAVNRRTGSAGATIAGVLMRPSGDLRVEFRNVHIDQ
jgi:curli biogenesis system outer membrane secretion channel CsgG